jgi:SAM-dependent methyltransferase
MTVATIPAVLAPMPGKPRLDNVPELQAFAAQVVVEGRWGPDVASVVTALFDQQAATWNAEHSVGRFDPVEDALHRGGVATGGRCLEVGSGTGQITPLLAAHFGQVVCIDLSAAMLDQAAASPGTRVRGDAAQMPFAPAVFDAAVLVDVFCFAGELARVLTDDGAVLWINVLGRDGPLYVPAADIARALPGEWNGVESTAGWGTWAALRRSHVAPAGQDDGDPAARPRA